MEIPNKRKLGADKQMLICVASNLQLSNVVLLFKVGPVSPNMNKLGRTLVIVIDTNLTGVIWRAS